MPITVTIPSEALAESIHSLSLEEKITLRQMLDQEIPENSLSQGTLSPENPWLGIFAEESEIMTDISNEAFENRKSFI
ncbi:hypothetical protein Syn7502_01522 [Synechococcus sp. PCC 7502]|uniref:hypothetical protein n=1 Tax=Synechococcus sp. PCC 7502 TaxID=1173263 RepID=UPI00029FAED0|nr:hypothetical protein [Synechococcus sp. PCC 7502]AFY73590.1 hypothetical protein Syn7502_01522 [Synechococcus sp. PCC 7502]